MRPSLLLLLAAILPSPTSPLVLSPLSFLAGGVAASVSHSASVPLDVIKTRQQTDPSLASQNPLSCALAIASDDGPSTLLAGLVPTLSGYFVQGSIKYGLFAAFKPAFLDSSLPHLPALALAAASAELIASTFLTPFEVFRISSVTDPSFSLRSLTPASAFSPLLPNLLKMIPYTALQLSTYELLRSDPSLHLPALLCASAAGVVSSLGSQPGDALLTRAALAPPGSDLLQSAFSLGPQGLFEGTV
jgi:solute carrier family 25 phosphate transporter 3